MTDKDRISSTVYGVQNPGSGLALQAYLDAVKNFLTWFATMQVSDPGNSFNDGAWNIGYEVNPAPPPTYRPAARSCR